MNENVGLNILSYFLQYKSNTLKEQEKKLGFEKKFVVPSTKKSFNHSSFTTLFIQRRKLLRVVHLLDVHVTTCRCYREI